MSARAAGDAERWMEHGTKILLDVFATIRDDALDLPSGLPGWRRRELLAHVAGNAEALDRLVAWARTGVETPMYSSPGQREADITAGAGRPAAALRSWVATSAARLADDWTALPPDRRLAKVRTARGRLVPAGEIPWLRAREVMVHTVDLNAGVEFADLPADFLLALGDDIVAKRSSASGPGLTLVATDADGRWQLPGPGPAIVTGPLPDLTAYLAGRPGALDGNGAPALPRWL
ncbi:MAG TPA: maleylpyruvate isomerase family mycothiol-dependent enzyme [Microlunatus sp.]|nr:maleylpyruvate isomerase family mycothiol-dependent enzyme [Microlunatus sp.]